MKIPAEYELQLLNALTINGFTLEESANVLNDLADNSSLGEAISRVYYQRTLKKESYEPLPPVVFNDPIDF